MAKNKNKNFNSNIEQKLIADGLNRETGKPKHSMGVIKVEMHLVLLKRYVNDTIVR